MKRLKIAVLISGRGSNMEALIEAAAADDYPARIVAVISNRPGAPGLKRAEAAGIPTQVIDHTAFAGRDVFENELNDALRTAKAELVCLAGFLRLLTPDFVSRWRNRLLNIHPSLLPAFKGLHTHDRALEAGVRFSGCTVHFVRPEMDDGPIVVQAAVPVWPDDTPERLAARILKVEHKIYPLAVRLVAEGRVRVAGNHVVIKGVDFEDTALVNPRP